MYTTKLEISFTNDNKAININYKDAKLRYNIYNLCAI